MCSLKWHISITCIKTQGTFQKRQKYVRARGCGGVLWNAVFQTQRAIPPEVTEDVIILRISAQVWPIKIPSWRNLGTLKDPPVFEDV